MKKLLALFSVISLLLLIWGCPNGIKKTHYNYNAYFPDQAVNLSDVNSIYDDYNSVAPETHFGKRLIFSSNRHSGGADFDLVGDRFHATWDRETGELKVDNSYYWDYTNYVAQLLNKINWEGNEYAPYAIGFDTVIDSIHKRINLLAYSTNNDSISYHEEFVYHESEDGGETGNVYGPFIILPSLINDVQQQYISFYGPSIISIDLWELNPNNFTHMYFDDASEGFSDIYLTHIPDSLNFMQFLMNDTTFGKEVVPALNSSSNDRCPFVNGNYMVFTSDRSGGYGGYDLYYSFYDGNEWGEPINFGEDINTAYDEFRPIAIQVYEFKNDLMMFSSNRPGGMGGYDLYYVGIDKIVPTIIVD